MTEHTGIYLGNDDLHSNLIGTNNTLLSDGPSKRPLPLWKKAVHYGGWALALVAIVVAVFLFLRDDKSTTPVNNEKRIDTAIFAFNDIYEIIPVGGFGGLSRVATYKKQIEAEFPDGVISVLPGDLYSPSALGIAKVDMDGRKRRLNGKQMVDVLNQLDLDLATLGNHEFDLPREDFLDRLQESKFTYVTTNVFDAISGEFFPNTISSTFITKKGITFAFFGIVIDDNMGSPIYGNIPDLEKSIQLAKDEIAKWRKEGRKWDVLVAITHVNLQDDIDIIGAIPEIDILLGGHEHENWYINRGIDRPVYITKADSNVKTVFTHRIQYYPDRVTVKKDGYGTAHLNPKAFVIESELRTIDARLENDPKVEKVVQSWWNIAKDAFSADGFDIDKKMAFIPGVGYDITEKYIRNSANSLFGTFLANSYYNHTISNLEQGVVKPAFAFFNSGSIRIDDHLRGVLTQYDTLRVLPFGGELNIVKTKGSVLIKAFHHGTTHPGNGNWMCYSSQLKCVKSTCQLLNPETDKYEDINPDAEYAFATVDFVAQGGDSYFTSEEVKILQTKFPLSLQEALRHSFETVYPYQNQNPRVIGDGSPSKFFRNVPNETL